MCDICRRSPCHPRCPYSEPRPLVECDKCERGIYADDEYYVIDGEIWCGDCISDCRKIADPDDFEFEYDF